jgi:hypothetical protein
MNTTLKQTGQKWLNWAVNIRKNFSSIRWFFIGFLYWLSDSRHFFPSDNAFKIKPPIFIPKVRWNKIPA